MGLLYLYSIIPHLALSQYWQGASMESGREDRGPDNCPVSEILYGNDNYGKGYLEQLFFLGRNPPRE